MHPVDRIRVRTADAIGSGIISLIIVAFVSALVDTGAFSGNLFSSEAYLVLKSLGALPILMTLAGLAIAVYRAGPFGLFGFLFELGGTNTLLNNPDGSAIVAIVFGAILVVFGAFIWSWTPILQTLVQSRNRRAPPRRGLR